MILFVCSGCERILGEENVNGWVIHATRVSQDEENGEEQALELCEGCILKMKYFKTKRK